jgi:ATP-dependent RNA helicase DDX41
LPADYKPYVPVAKRRAQLKSTLTGKQQSAKRTKVSLDELQREIVPIEEDNEEEKAREKLRRERTLLQAAQEVKEQKALAGEQLCRLTRVSVIMLMGLR